MSSTSTSRALDGTPRSERRLRGELGMSETGLLVVQPTRVVPRKGIELAIELVGRLEDPDAVLLITSPAGDEGLDYLVELERLAEKHHVRLAYAADRFAPDHEGKPLAPRALAPRRLPRRRPDHVPEPVRGLRKRPPGGALLRRPGRREPLSGVRGGHRAARPQADRDRRRDHRQAPSPRSARSSPTRIGSGRGPATTSRSRASTSHTESCGAGCGSC